LSEHNQHPANLAGWLSYLEQIHPAQIDMGLDRVAEVYDRLNLNFDFATVIMVGGTNGKGSTCRFLELIAQQMGLSTAVYSSPHIIDYRERVRVNQALLSEEDHCRAFSAVEAARKSTSLTYFEFGTLAAMQLMAELRPDVVILEVGLGGRLDAVNIVEPDVSVITTIDLDHQAWLGNTREQIGFEKAGIMRPNKPCIVGELDAPETLKQHGEKIAADLYFREGDFQVNQNHQEWSLTGTIGEQAFVINELPVGNLPVQNAATALFTAKLLNWNLSDSQFRQLIANASLPGRMERLAHSKNIILDVAHNPQATAYLRSRIDALPYRRLIFILGMLSDKDSRASLEAFHDLSATWFVTPLDCPRSSTAEALQAVLIKQEQSVKVCESVEQACQQALESASDPNDLIVGFGSFYTVSAIKQALTTQ